MNWDSDGCTMKMVTQCYRVRLENVKDSDIDRMMKRFQSKMKLRYRIPPFMVEKYKDVICFMVETDTTCMDEVEPRVKFIEPMGYEMSEELIEGYMQMILYLDKDTRFPRWGTYEEKMKEVHFELHSKEIKRNVEKKNIIHS